MYRQETCPYAVPKYSHVLTIDLLVKASQIFCYFV